MDSVFLQTPPMLTWPYRKPSEIINAKRPDSRGTELRSLVLSQKQTENGLRISKDAGLEVSSK